MDFAVLAAGGSVLREHQVIRPMSDDADPLPAHFERAAFHAQRPGRVGTFLAGIVEVLPSGIRADFLWIEASWRRSALLAHCDPENIRRQPHTAVRINPTRRGVACYRAEPSMAELKQRSRKRAGALEGAPRTVSARSQRKLIAILSRKPSLYSTRRLVEAAGERGHRAIVVDTMRCIMVLIPEAP